MGGWMCNNRPTLLLALPPFPPKKHTTYSLW
jgi:hypothetical protein